MSDAEWWSNSILVGSASNAYFTFLDAGNGSVVHDVNSGVGSGGTSYDATMVPPTDVVVGCHSGGLCCFDLETREWRADVETPANWTSTCGVTSMVSSDGASLVAGGGSDGTVGVWRFGGDEEGALSLIHDFKPSYSRVNDLRYVSLPTPSLVTATYDKSLRVYDVERESSLLGSIENCVYNGGWCLRIGYSEAHSSVFVMHPSTPSAFRQIDLRSMTYAIDLKDTRSFTGANNPVFSLSVVDNNHYLVCTGNSGFVVTFDLRNLQNPIFSIPNAHGGSHCYTRAVLVSENTIALGGHNSSSYKVRTWNLLDGTPGWVSNQMPSSCDCLLTPSIDSQRFASHSRVTIPTTEMGEFIASDQCGERKTFLIENLELLHDAKIILSNANGELGVIHTFQSFVLSGQMGNEEIEETEFKHVKEYHIPLSSDHLSLDEETFNGVILGVIPIAELVKDSTAVMDLCVILSSLRMKRLLWFVCEQLKEVSTSLELRTSFQLLKTAHKTFEPEEEGEDEEDEEEAASEIPVFESVVTMALFEGFRTKQDSRLLKSMNKWLGWRELSFPFRSTATLPPLRTHRSLEIPDGESFFTPTELLSSVFERFADNCSNPNIELVPRLGGGSCIFTHVEALVLSFDFFKVMLGFQHGTERGSFESGRRIEMENQSSCSLSLLSQFCYVGKFFDPNVSLSDLLLVLRLAESSSPRLTEYTVAIIQSIDTKEPTFLEDLLRIGNGFEDIQAKIPILEAWASQGSISLKKLQKQLARAAEMAETTNEMETMRREIADLRRMVRDLWVSREEEKAKVQELMVWKSRVEQQM